MLVDRALLRGQRLAAAEFLQHVVQAGEGEIGMGGLLAFAVGVELFPQDADTVGGVVAEGFAGAGGAVRVDDGDADGAGEFVGGVEVGERERVKTCSRMKARAILQCSGCDQAPSC